MELWNVGILGVEISLFGYEAHIGKPSAGHYDIIMITIIG